jgi:hypothetical protein
MIFQAPKPPPIEGEVPKDYSGPVYYRLRTTGDNPGAPLSQSITFADRARAQKLSRISQLQAAFRKDPNLCDANGTLLSEWQTPLKGKLKASARNSFEEISWSAIPMVSERVREVIEELAPGVHYFIPMDVEDRQGETFRAYGFHCGLTDRQPALALEAHGIPFTLSGAGDRLYTPPAWLRSTQFGLLDSAVLDGASLRYDATIGLLFSAELVRRLGGVMPKGTVFVPMGVA